MGVNKEMHVTIECDGCGFKRKEVFEPIASTLERKLDFPVGWVERFLSDGKSTVHVMLCEDCAIKFDEEEHEAYRLLIAFTAKFADGRRPYA